MTIAKSPKLIIPDPSMRITGIPGFEDVRYLPLRDGRSNGRGLPPDVRARFSRNPPRLASADEIAALSVVADGWDQTADEHCEWRTSTLTYHFLHLDKVMVAVVDDPGNELLGKASLPPLAVPRVPSIEENIDRALAAGRAFPASRREWRTVPLNKYACDPQTRAILPRTATLYAKWLKEIGCKRGALYSDTRLQSLERGLDRNTVLVNAVLLRINPSDTGDGILFATPYLNGQARYVWTEKDGPATRHKGDR